MREAKQRYRLSILNFNVTCNHIHLLLDDLTGGLSIPRAMQLVEGCTAEEYNARKGRLGSFWTDRYQATAVESGSHLLRCFAYIDLNMVRAGAVHEPGEWSDCGYRHVQTQRRRNVIIDYDNLMAHLGVSSMPALIKRQRELLETERHFVQARQPLWTESVAVGSLDYVTRFRDELQKRTGVRKNIGEPQAERETAVLREPRAGYEPRLRSGVYSIEGDNHFFWKTGDQHPPE